MHHNDALYVAAAILISVAIGVNDWSLAVLLVISAGACVLIARLRQGD